VFLLSVFGFSFVCVVLLVFVVCALSLSYVLLLFFLFIGGVRLFCLFLFFLVF